MIIYSRISALCPEGQYTKISFSGNGKHNGPHPSSSDSGSYYWALEPIVS